MGIGELAGFFASILATLTFAPQVIKTWRTKNSKDLSAMMLTFSLLGNIGWLINGLSSGNAPLIFSGALISLLLMPLFYVKYANGELLGPRALKARLASGIQMLFMPPRTDP